VSAAQPSITNVVVSTYSFSRNNLDTVDLFGQPVRGLQLVRLDRRTDRARPCHENLAVVDPTPSGPHAAALRCANCGQHRGWMPRQALEFLADPDAPVRRANRTPHPARLEHHWRPRHERAATRHRHFVPQ
jgi:hypothetical protein